MDEEEFKRRTKRVGLLSIQLSERFPKSVAGQVVARQLVRCGTSVGANYRAACRARSTPDMLSKLAIVEEEADEVLYWLELAELGRLLLPEATAELATESAQVLAMVVASIRTLRKKL